MSHMCRKCLKNVFKEGHFDYVRAVRLTYNVREEKVGNISYLWRKKVASYLSDVDNPASGK